MKRLSPGNKEMGVYGLSDTDTCARGGLYSCKLEFSSQEGRK